MRVVAITDLSWGVEPVDTREGTDRFAEKQKQPLRKPLLQISSHEHWRLIGGSLEGRNRDMSCSTHAAQIDDVVFNK